MKLPEYKTFRVLECLELMCTVNPFALPVGFQRRHPPFFATADKPRVAPNKIELYPRRTARSDLAAIGKEKRRQYGLNSTCSLFLERENLRSHPGHKLDRRKGEMRPKRKNSLPPREKGKNEIAHTPFDVQSCTCVIQLTFNVFSMHVGLE